MVSRRVQQHIEQQRVSEGRGQQRRHTRQSSGNQHRQIRPISDHHPRGEREYNQTLSVLREVLHHYLNNRDDERALRQLLGVINRLFNWDHTRLHAARQERTD